MDKFTDHELAQELRARGNAVALWNFEDVVVEAKELGIDIPISEAENIIRQIDNDHDCNYGITWETIRCYLEDWEER